MMRNSINYGFLAAMMLCQCTYEGDEQESSSSCEPRPSNCITSESRVRGVLEIQVDINALNPEVEVAVYAGLIGEKLVFKDKITSSKKITLDCGVNYSAKVTYRYQTKDGRIATITAYDEEDLDADSEYYCEGSCYTIPSWPTQLDLRLQTSLLPDSVRARWKPHPL